MTTGRVPSEALVPPAQRVEIGHQVTADAVGTNEVGHLHLLMQHLLFAVGLIVVGSPLLGLVRHAKACENLVIETVLTNQQFVHALQEHAAFGTLDDAVVVSARDGYDLRDAQF